MAELSKSGCAAAGLKSTSNSMNTRTSDEANMFDDLAKQRRLGVTGIKAVFAARPALAASRRSPPSPPSKSPENLHGQVGDKVYLKLGLMFCYRDYLRQNSLYVKR